MTRKASVYDMKPYNMLYRHSLVDWLLPTLSVCVSVYLCVCLSRFYGFISLTMSRILIKRGENVGTLVRLIVLKFEHSAAKGNTIHKW